MDQELIPIKAEFDEQISPIYNYQNEELPKRGNDQQTKWKVQVQVAKQLTQGNQNSKQEILDHRVLKFFLYNNKMDKDEYICQMPDQVDYSNKDLMIENKIIILYGIDFFSDKQLKTYFQPYQLIKINRINDSTCKIQFQNQETLIKALKTTIKNAQNIDIIDKKEWYELKPLFLSNFQRIFYARYATSQDKAISEKQGFKNFAYEKAKKIYLQKQGTGQLIHTRRINRSRIQKPVKNLKSKVNKQDAIRIFTHDINQDIKVQQHISISDNDDINDSSLSLGNIYNNLSIERPKKPRIYEQSTSLCPLKSFNYKEYLKQDEQKIKKEREKLNLIIIDQ